MNLENYKMIETKMIDGLRCPMFICAFCDTPISDITTAMIFFHPQTDKVLLVGHKSCHPSKKEYPYSIELEVFLDQLTYNSKTKLNTPHESTSQFEARQ